MIYIPKKTVMTKRNERDFWDYFVVSDAFGIEIKSLSMFLRVFVDFVFLDVLGIIISSIWQNLRIMGN